MCSLVAKKISGTVVKDLIANPFPTDPEYRSILRKRALEAGEKTRGVALESQGRQLEYLKPSRGNGPGWGGLGVNVGRFRVLTFLEEGPGGCGFEGGAAYGEGTHGHAVQAVCRVQVLVAEGAPEEN